MNDTLRADRVGRVSLGGVLNQSSRDAPLVPVAVAVIVGFCAASWIGESSNLFVWVLVLAGCLAGIGLMGGRKEAPASNWAIWPDVGVWVGWLLLAGVCWGVWGEPQRQLSARDVSHWVGQEDAWVRARLVVQETPRVVSGGRFAYRQAGATVENLWTNDGPVAVDGVVLSHWPVTASAGAGERVVVIGKLRKPRGTAFEGDFDLAGQLGRQGIFAELRVSGVVAREGREAISLVGRWQAMVRGWLNAGLDESSQEALVLRRLLLGDGHPKLREVEETFREMGVSHLLAISGQHMAVVALGAYVVSRVLGLHPRTSAAWATGVVVMYAVSAAASAPVVRSAIAFVLVGVGLMLGWKTGGKGGGRGIGGVGGAMNVLAGVFVVMALLHPASVRGAGFQLTFAAVAGLLMFTGPLVRWMQRLRDVDMVVADAWQPMTLRARWHRWLAGWVYPPLAGGLGAWAASLPVAAWHFGSISVLAVPITLLLSPLVTLTLLLAMIKVWVTGLLGWGGGAAAWPGAGVGYLAERSAGAMMQWADTLGGWAEVTGVGTVILPRPAGWMIGLYVAGLVWPLVWRVMRPVSDADELKGDTGKARIIRPGLAWTSLVGCLGPMVAMGSVCFWPSRGGPPDGADTALIVVEKYDRLIFAEWTEKGMQPLASEDVAVVNRLARALGAKAIEPKAYADRQDELKLLLEVLVPEDQDAREWVDQGVMILFRQGQAPEVRRMGMAGDG